MIEQLSELLTGQYKILFWFIIAIVFIYIPCMYFWLKNRKDKAAAYEHEHPNAVKVYIQRTKSNDLLRIISVNDEKPVVHSKGIKYGFYLLPGKNTIHVVYQWTTQSITSLSGYETHPVDDEKLDVMIEAGKEYLLSYNHTLKKYELILNPV